MPTPYQRAIDWIALNDDAGADYAFVVEDVADMMTVVLVADVYNRTPETVAKAVIAVRQAESHRAQP